MNTTRTQTNGAATSKRLDRRKILVVEDSADSRDLLSHMLRGVGAEVEVAVDGDEGLRKATAKNHDLLLLDLDMPTNGFTVIRELKAKNYRSPILAITAHDSIEVKDRCHEAGFDGYIAKPFNAESLIATIQGHLFQNEKS